MDKNIEAFKKIDSNKAIEILFKDNCELQQRIKKSIEILEELYKLPPMEYGREEQIEWLLNILKGDSNE